MNRKPRRRHLHALPDPQSRFEKVTRIAGRVDDALPAPVQAEMSDADELWESLRADGKQLRYDVDSSSGRVSVDLCDLDGTRLRAVPLSEALGVPDGDDDLAG